MTDFSRLQDATPADWAAIAVAEGHAQTSRNAGDGLLRLLRAQEHDDDDGWPINIYQHCLQSATLAHQAGADDETIFCALFHDATEIIGLHDHGLLTATMLAPYISEEARWLVEHHAVFQNRFATHHPFRPKDAYEQFRGHPSFERTMYFCEHFDANAFARNFEAMPLEAFEPLVDRICRPHLPRAGGA